MECNHLLDEFPNVSESVKVITFLSSGRVSGSDIIPVEINKTGGPLVAEKLTELLHIIWRKEAIPQTFKDATIILFSTYSKGKGNLKSVTIIEACFSCQLLRRSLQDPNESIK